MYNSKDSLTAWKYFPLFFNVSYNFTFWCNTFLCKKSKFIKKQLSWEDKKWIFCSSIEQKLVVHKISVLGKCVVNVRILPMIILRNFHHLCHQWLWGCIWLFVILGLSKFTLPFEVSFSLWLESIPPNH